MWDSTYAVDEAKRLIPEQQTQRQDSTTDQLITVMELANRAGCYDASDWIKARIVDMELRRINGS